MGKVDVVEVANELRRVVGGELLDIMSTHHTHGAHTWRA
jgi:hypothetical protein